MLVQMAFKNVFRNRKRTMITLSAIFLGVYLTIVANGFNKGMEWQTDNLTIKTDTGMIKLVAKGFTLNDNLEDPLDFPVRHSEKVITALKANRQVLAYSPRITFHGNLSNGIKEIKAVGLGVEPALEERLFRRKSGIIAGQFLESGQNGLVLGTKLAQLLELKIGDNVTVISKGAEMGLNAYDLELTGIIGTGNPAVDSTTFFVTADFAKQFLTFNDVTDIALSIKDLTQAEALGKALQTQFQGKITPYYWRDYTKGFRQLVEMQKQLTGIMTLIILLMAAASITNTMLMAVMERKREIGNLMAQGVRPVEILGLFLLEGVVIGVLGSISGAVLGFFTVFYFQNNGIALTATGMAGQLQNVPIGSKLYMVLDWANMVLTLGLGIVVATLATFYPATQSAKLRPLEALTGNRG